MGGKRDTTKEVQRRISIGGHRDRKEGLTTTLLDIAIANARRGEQVLFWTENPQEAHRVFREARNMIYAGRDTEAEPQLSGIRYCDIRWPETERGSLTFGFDAIEMQLRGFRATVVVNDVARCPTPESQCAHTVIYGG